MTVIDWDEIFAAVVAVIQVGWKIAFQITAFCCMAKYLGS